jgi:hypothetical protein
MKQSFFLLVVTALFLVILPAGLKAQEKQQTKLYVIIEENGKVTKDTSVIVDKSLSEKEVQEIITGITGEMPHPCQAHQAQRMHGNTMADTCKYMKNMKKEIQEEECEEDNDVEVRVVHGAPGKETIIVEEDGDVIIIRNGHGRRPHCIKEISEMEADSLACKEKEVKIIKIRDDNADVKGGSENKVIKTKVIVTDEGEKAEKTIIIESPEKTGKSEKKQK